MYKGESYVGVSKVEMGWRTVLPFSVTLNEVPEKFGFENANAPLTEPVDDF